MLMENFQISRPVGTGHSRPADVIRLRKALHETGHGSSPPDPSGVYDTSLNATIKRFQTDYGLPPDGIVAPDSPTARMIDIVLMAQRQGGDEGQAQLRNIVNATVKAGFKPDVPPPGDNRPIVFTDANSRIATPDQMTAIIGHSLKPSNDRRNGTTSAPAAVAAATVAAPTADGMAAGGGLALSPEAAAMLADLGPIGLGAAALVIGSYKADQWGKAHPEYLAQKQSERDAVASSIADLTARQRARRDTNGAQRTIDTTSGAAIYPGSHEPPDLPNRTEFPAEPPDRSKDNGIEAFPAQPSQPEILKGPEIQEARPGIFVFPDLTGSFNDWMILERRRGNEKTRAGLEKLRDYFHEVILGGNPEWEHIAGGRDKKTKQEKAEFWIPGPQKDFQRKGETIDGRKGGKFADLTFENQRTGEIIHVQSVDTDKNGKPTERELNNAEIIRKRTRASVYLFAKDAIPQ